MDVPENADFEIGNALELDEKLLQVFYRKYFKERKYSLIDWWKWQYRVEKKNSPFVAIKNNQIAAHSGYIPFNLSFQGEQLPSRWYIDFMVDKDFRRQGLGSLLTKQLMSLNGLTIAITGNEKSMGAFRKLKWRENFDSYLIYLPINPESLPFLMNRFSATQLSIIGPILKALYTLNALRFFKYRRSSITRMKIDKTTINNLNSTFSGIAQIYPLRDSAFWRWRILESPDLEKYRIIRIDDSHLLFKEIRDAKGETSIELFYIDQSLSIKQRLELIKKLYLWSVKEGYSYIRLYTTNSDLKKRLRFVCGALDSKAAFAYYVNSKVVHSTLSDYSFDFQFVDNDFEDL